MSVDEGLQPLTLMTLNDGDLEAQFQQRHTEALEALANHSQLRAKGGMIEVTIPMEVKIVLNPADRTYILECRADHVKLPKPYTSQGKGYLRDGELKVRPEPRQQTLGSVSPLPKPTG